MRGTVLRTFAADPVSGEPILLKDGRFGPYVTDHTTNAALRRGDDAESLTFERAAQLLAQRRARQAAERRRAESPE